jgi:hypothetical protein
MRYEYQVLESDSASVPPEMLNEQGDEGWLMCGITIRDVKPPQPSGFSGPVDSSFTQHWIFYFVRPVTE